MVTISSRRSAALLALGVAFFAATGLAVVIVSDVYGHKRLHGLVPLFDLDAEFNLPTAFSMALLLIAALLMAVVSRDPSSLARRTKRGWTILSVLTLCVAFDEVASFHEQAGESFRSILGLEDVGAFHFAWTLPAGVVMFALAPMLLRLAASLGPRVRWLAATAGILYVGGALGVEMLDGAYAARFGEENVGYGLLTGLEEVLEMCGAALFDYSMLVHLSGLKTTLEIEFR